MVPSRRYHRYLRIDVVLNRAQQFGESPADTARTLLVSSEVVDVETDEKTAAQLSVPTDSTTFAIEKFEKKCRKSGYQPVEKPNIEVQ